MNEIIWDLGIWADNNLSSEISSKSSSREGGSKVFECIRAYCIPGMIYVQNGVYQRYIGYIRLDKIYIVYNNLLPITSQFIIFTIILSLIKKNTKYQIVSNTFAPMQLLIIKKCIYY